MPDFSESMALKIAPDAREMSAALNEWGRRADDLSARMGKAMVQGMSAAAGAGPGGMAAGRTTDPMAALTTIPEQERLLKMQVEQAGPLLRRMNIYRESQEKRAQAASRREFMGGLGRAAMGEAIGEIGGLGGIGAMVAGGMTPAAVVTGGVEAIKKPFDIMARIAENSARSLAAMNSNLGVVSQGLENSAQKWRWVPLIGEHMGRMYDAERQREETMRAWLHLYSPGLASRIEYSQDVARTTLAAGNQRFRESQRRAYGLDELAEDRANVLGGRLQGELEAMGGPNWWNRNMPRWAQPGSPRTDRLEALMAAQKRAEEETKRTGGLSKETETSILANLRKAGVDVAAATPPARPAQITGIEDYLTDLYTRFATLGPQGGPEEAMRNNTAALDRNTEEMRNRNNDHAGEGVDRAMDQDFLGSGGDF